MAGNNADRIQSVINDDLFPNVQHVSDVKQVLEFMTDYAAPLSEGQVRAIILLEKLGENTRIHGKSNPYKRAVSRTETYLETIEELIPKPPKPVIMTDSGRVIKPGRG
jgi:hypothetical protein